MSQVMQNMQKRKLGGAIYILPNLLTTGNLFFGFFSIIKTLQDQFAMAAFALFIAGIFDILDGRIARLTNATSEFGVQYDSLCDLMSFGLAPAFLMYQYGLNQFGRVGWIACFIFLACGALRLARFNVQSSIGKASGDFVGLPIPMSALTIACYVAFLEDLKVEGASSNFIARFIYRFSQDVFWADLILIISCFFLAIAMVSNFPYRSHKTFHIQGVKPFRMLAIFVLCIGLAASWPEFFGVLITFGYAVSGPGAWLLGWRKMHDDDEIFTPHSEGGSLMEPHDD